MEKKSYNSLYAITESCKTYRCTNNQFYHPKSLFHIFWCFNKTNCIFWEYFIDLLLLRNHYFRLSVDLLQMYSLVNIHNSFVYNDKLSCDNKCQISKLKAKWPN